MSSLPISFGLVGWISWLFLALACEVTSAQESSDKTASKVQAWVPGVAVERLAEHPDLVTPTGIDLDSQGNIWVVSSHTHFRPSSYQGPEFDEILVFDSEGKNRRVFYNKTKATMQLLWGPDGWLYVAQRDRILRVKDSDNDGVGDTEETIAGLDTLADYPHNGLSGMTWHTDGGLIFSLGENFGKDWTLRGSDGKSLLGRGEGGVFHCTKAGGDIRRIAKGFWNPFGLWMRSDGVLFAAENDPGSRPPCRLLHVVEGGDYGFQYVYGSAPVHPFVCWEGQLRGTLGMIHPSGEGPCAVVGLGGGVMIPSWSNHCIDYYPLRWQGATLQAQRIELLRGSDMFRPTGMVRKNDREYYFADWVSPSYELHGMGRLWKLTIDPERADWLVKESQEWTPEAQLAERLRSGLGLSDAERSIEALFGWVQGSDPFLADAAQRELARIARDWSQAQWRALPSERRVGALVAMRKEDFQNPRWVRMLWSDPDPEIRFESLRWIADGVWKEYLPEVQKMLDDPALEYRLFEAALATTNTLKGDPSQGVTDAKMLVERITHPNTPARIAAYAMRLAPAEHHGLGIVELKHLLDRNDPDLTREVVRSLALRKDQESQELLGTIARDASMDESFRLDALAGLIGTSQPTEKALVESLAKGPEGSLAREAQRVMRQSGLDPEVPSVGSTSRQPRNLDQWLEALGGLDGAPDPQAGRRIFFHVAGAACSQCHRHEGRGNVVGPDLSLIAKQGTAREILESILEPNREVAPQFYTTHLELTDGSDFTGILLRSSSNEVYRNGFGQEVTFQKSEIQDRKELRSSLMPTGLLDTMSDREVRDLMAFLLQSSR
ncbi:MAG: c-type cytochrome [Planctomycetota bacterium]|nr:c-type cytochrome [Planctomycetota bacterium]